MNTPKTVDSKIEEYLPLLSYKQKKAVLAVVKNFAEVQTDRWDEISEEQRQEIDNAILEMESGKVVSNDEVMKPY